MDLTSITPTPTALRALAHPTRLRMLGLLRLEGPATATSLAARLGLNTGATSYHLRQLAKHGFVEEDSTRGNARERWWRAAHQATRTDAESYADQGAQDTFDAYLQAVAVVYTQRLQRAVEERGLLPRQWRKASTYSDWGLRLTPARARELSEALATLVEGWDEEPDAGDAGEFIVHLLAFPEPGTVTGVAEDRR
ncbi:MAG TPA: helix-turn-helix domain-containing protein [Marmoricola sp.]|nr:helix-turn-helix domain-containing protein [Marmoricola sp.]